MELLLGITSGCLAGALFYYYRKSKQVEKININTIAKNKEISNLNIALSNKERALRNDIYLLGVKQCELLQSNEFLTENLEKRKQDMTQLANSAFENYCETLNIKYKETEEEYDKMLKTVENSFAERTDDLRTQCNIIEKELEKMRELKKAIVAANVREEEIKQQQDFYCLKPTLSEITDIQTLEEVKSKLFNPRILSMLIWSTFFQKNMTALCNRVIGTEKKSGIYKITNQTNQMCYIGQSVDIANRWKDHAKHGLGIDAPATNKLYNAMQKDGIWNFSWEVLEECSRDKLNEMERYYIDLYQSEAFGYNSTRGNK